MSEKEITKLSKESKLNDLVKQEGVSWVCRFGIDTVNSNKDLKITQILNTDPFNTPFWSSWVLRFIPEYFTEDVLIELVKNACKEPIMAFNAYIDCPSLTDEMDKLLEQSFKGKLLTAEKELKDGIVSRKKK